MNTFSDRVLKWFESQGRHNLPWQINPSPYRVWVSEIMLQQTQVTTVIPYYERFMNRFPTISDLAKADIDQVLHLWTGLGYYARARNLHKTAQIITIEYRKQFPNSVDILESLPGIGRSTAGAIAALSMNKQAAILDGNVKRVLTRFYAIKGWPDETNTKKRLWELAEKETPKKNVASYTQGIMDLGATVCTRSKPDCIKCPLISDCSAFLSKTIENFPGKKPKKSLPTKSVVMYIFRNELSEVLLEKRPPNGIWGSLYSFPEVVPTQNNHRIKKELPGVKLQFSEKNHGSDLEPLTHNFSHFRLSIRPQLIEIMTNECDISDSSRWLWYPLNQSLEVGLAAPVKKLLYHLPQKNN